MPLWVVVGALVALTGVMWVLVARERGPTPEDVALAYEHAWDRLDFATLWDLSGDELRDGHDREAFVASRREAHERAGTPPRVATRIGVDAVTVGDRFTHVVTRLEDSDGTVRNDVLLERRRSRWEVVGYSLHPETEAPSSQT